MQPKQQEKTCALHSASRSPRGRADPPVDGLSPHRRPAKARRRHGPRGEEGAVAPAAGAGHLARQGVEAQGSQAGAQGRARKEARQVRCLRLLLCSCASTHSFTLRVCTGRRPSVESARRRTRRSSSPRRAATRSARPRVGGTPRSSGASSWVLPSPCVLGCCTTRRRFRSFSRSEVWESHRDRARAPRRLVAGVPLSGYACTVSVRRVCIYQDVSSQCQTPARLRRGNSDASVRGKSELRAS